MVEDIRKWIAENVRTREEAKLLIELLLEEQFQVSTRKIFLEKIISELRERFSIWSDDYEEDLRKGVELEQCFRSYITRR